MAILKRATRRGRTVAALSLAVLGVAGCVLVDALVQTPRPFAFSHRQHVEDEGLECSDCHGADLGSAEPGFPRAAQCALCHADLDAEKPPDLQVASLFEGETFRAARGVKLADEVRFSHPSHVTRGLECVACHAQVATDEGHLEERGAELGLSMAECLACHAASAGPAQDECAACHAQIRSDVAPPNHVANWTRYHGSLVRARSEARADSCVLCHEPADCSTCHQAVEPASHNNFWRRRGHGITAALDRESCATCHDSDSCQRCHDEIRPQSHVGSWGEPRDRHCLACHEPLRGESCGVCHATAPSHELATPLPADHLPGMNCRQCHGAGQPLPHVDNGQSCTGCHR